MTSDSEPMESDFNGSTTTQSSWIAWLTMPLLLLLGWVVYEITMLPGLAALFMCLKFGWADFRTAFWLRQTDPNKPRGQACFWLYVTSGVWKVAFMGLFMAILVGILYLIQLDLRPMGPRKQEQQSAEQLAHGALVVLMAGLGVCSLLSVHTTLIGRRNRVRYWLASGIHRDRELQHWPPRQGQNNRATIVLITGLTLFVLFTVPPVALLLLIGIRQFVPIPRPYVVILCLFVIFWGVPWLVASLMDWVRKWMIADRPADCWEVIPLPVSALEEHSPAHPDDVWMAERSPWEG
ncbi:hypothetical protein [Tuwongella immobilis]|uniref:Uncharacterized protein n=1 Tax=Tuwongella immobilis TaxID=692036 RepID=A0A6C2YWQ2_9BACT|nr:hypothetical protein [Tuwongella immobilis]VIP05787.1 unnamed protein product [Tuwongella immobilis]VTS08930.1 unnamed protein product [Tuwongella immobilis]